VRRLEVRGRQVHPVGGSSGPGAKDGRGEGGAGAETDIEEESAGDLFFWFFFPLPGDLVAWEATTGTGRATYFFRTGGKLTGNNLPDTVRSLTRGMALINFRREPVYLSDTSLEQPPRFHRYAVGARKLADLWASAERVCRAGHTFVPRRLDRGSLLGFDQ